MNKKPTQAERDEFEQFARAAAGLNRMAPKALPDSPTSVYMGHHTTSRNANDLTARELSGKHVGELNGVPPRNPRDPKAKG